MSWLKGLRDTCLEAIGALDQLVDRAAAGFDADVMPAIEGAAGWLDNLVDGKGTETEANRLDERYQQFMVRHVDTLFGRERSAHLEEIGGLDISPGEQILNRRLAYTVVAFIAIAGGGALYPPSLYISVPAAFSMMLPVYEMAYRSVKQQRKVTFHVISVISTTGIWLGGYYTPAIAAMVFFYLSEKLLLITEDRSRKGVIAVFSKQPRTVWRLRDGQEEELLFEELLSEDVIVVDAGGAMPVDGTVVSGLASIDQHMLTGEAQPVEKSPGDTVYAATMVLAGKLHVRVDKAGDQTVAAKIGEILNSTASYQMTLQSRGSKLAHKAALPTLIMGGVTLVSLGPESALAIINSSFGFSVRTSAPITMLNLLNIASRNGILLKDGRSLELLSEIDTVLFDKTGTLTIAQPHVVAIHAVRAFDKDRLLQFAAAAEHRQAHPIALAILAEAEARGLSLPDVSNARYEVGYGIKVKLGEQTIQVGSDRFMHLSDITIPKAIRERQEACHVRGHSLIMVAVDGRLAGAIELQPTIRPEARAVIQSLKQRGLQLMIVSGDQEEPTRQLAEQLGLDRYFANVLPEGKASLVEQLQAEGRSVCFVGDGINDSIALRKAKVSVSMRGATTVAMDVAQVVMMQESLQQLPYLFELSGDMDSGMKVGYAVGMAPGVLNVAGVYLLGWGFYQSLVLNVITSTMAMGVAMYPLYKHRERRAQAQLLTNGAQLELTPPVETGSERLLESEASSNGVPAGAPQWLLPAG